MKKNEKQTNHNSFETFDEEITLCEYNRAFMKETKNLNLKRHSKKIGWNTKYKQQVFHFKINRKI